MKTDELGSFQCSLLMFRKNGCEGRDPCHLSGGPRLLGGRGAGKRPRGPTWGLAHSWLLWGLIKTCLWLTVPDNFSITFECLLLMAFSLGVRDQNALWGFIALDDIIPLHQKRKKKVFLTYVTSSKPYFSRMATDHTCLLWFSVGVKAFDPILAEAAARRFLASCIQEAVRGLPYLHTENIH